MPEATYRNPQREEKGGEEGNADEKAMKINRCLCIPLASCPSSRAIGCRSLALNCCFSVR
jgi:hypothetical protein